MPCYLDRNIILCNQPTPIAGSELRMYAVSRRNIGGWVSDTENKAIITDLFLQPGSCLYRFEGFKKSNGFGFDRVQSNTAIQFNQYVKIDDWGISSQEISKLNKLDDLVIIVESINKGFNGDGAFRIYGLQVGMYVENHSARVNENNGIATIEWRNLEGQYEGLPNRVFFKNSYEESKEYLDNLVCTDAGLFDWSSTLITFDDITKTFDTV